MITKQRGNDRKMNETIGEYIDNIGIKTVTDLIVALLMLFIGIITIYCIIIGTFADFSLMCIITILIYELYIVFEIISNEVKKNGK